MAKIAKLQEVAVNDLKPYEKNAKIHGQDQIEKLKDSIRAFGFLTPCLIDREMNLIAGHGRVMAAKELGIAEVPCVMIEDLTEEQRRAYVLADNRLSELGEWDMSIVQEELQTLKDEGFDTSLTGFSIDDIIFTDDMSPDITEAEIEGLKNSVEPRVKRGDIWQLGEHRLMCGDSTNTEDVSKLMSGRLADLFLTDPPYNVALGVGDTPEIAKKRKRRTDGLKIENDSMEEGEFLNFLESAFNNASEHMKPGAAYYCWYGGTSQKSFQTALENAALIPHQILIWVKSSLVLGRQDYQWRHEPCFYGWKEGAAHYFIDVRSFSTVMDGIETMAREDLIEKIKELASITTAIYEDKPNTNEFHPTMKPLGLFEKLIRNSTREKEIVLDLFCGSGTSVLASEEMNRRCFAMEYDPNYCDVIITRWEEATGRKAGKINV